MSPKRLVGLAALLAVVLVGVAFYGLVWSGHADRTTIESVSVEATLNDEFSPSGVAEGSDDRISCTASGTPPDQYSVRVAGTIRDPTTARQDGRDRYDLVVRIGSANATRTVRAVDSGRTSFQAFLTLPDDESVAPGERADVTVAIRTDYATVDAVTQSVRVGSGTWDCVESQG